MMRRAIRLAAALALVAFAACNIQPQPLPPGMLGGDKGGDVPTGEPGGGEASGPSSPPARDGGSVPPPASSDAGALNDVDGGGADAAVPDADDAGPRDGGSDAPEDASTDGALGPD